MVPSRAVRVFFKTHIFCVIGSFSLFFDWDGFSHKLSLAEQRRGVSLPLSDRPTYTHVAAATLLKNKEGFNHTTANPGTGFRQLADAVTDGIEGANKLLECRGKDQEQPRSTDLEEQCVLDFERRVVKSGLGSLAFRGQAIPNIRRNDTHAKQY